MTPSEPQRWAENVIHASRLPSPARDDALTVLRANPTEVPTFLLALAREAGVSLRTALARAAAIQLNIAALQIADDIADGDCNYLDHPLGTGTAAQFMLQNLFYATLVDADLPLEVVKLTAHDLFLGAAPQSVDVRRHRTWALDESRAAAIGFGGQHHRAYLRLVLHGSALQERAPDMGFGLGIGLFVANDIRSNDARFSTLSSTDKIRLADFAIGSLAPVQALDSPTMRRALIPIENLLVGALVGDSPSPDR